MPFLRKLIALIFIAACGVGSYLILSKGPCDSPITYRIGDFDAKFGISRADFLADAAEAEKVWENALDVPKGTVKKQLFIYDPKGSLPIHLVYDTRQAVADKTKVLTQKIDTTIATADSIKPQLAALKAEYDQAEKEYRTLVASFETRLSAYNSRVAALNARGGARRDEYASLEQEKSALEALQKQANEKMIGLNDLARQVNALVAKYNALARTANVDVSAVNQNADKEFEQGDYVRDSAGERINVYEFDGKAKLVRLLAHEMGHALGLEHNSNPESIMYYLNNGTTLVPSEDDIKALRAACKL